MADIFVSYTSSDSQWAQWIATDLRALGHTPHVHEWEIGPGEDILAWMQHHHAAADHVLCVVSEAYLKAPYSTLERNAATWRAARERTDFVLFVVVQPCALPTLIEHLRRCEVFNLPEAAARQRFRKFMTARTAPDHVIFPGHATAQSNITIRVPHHFMGRDDDMAEIEATLRRFHGRAAITALRGMRGVGKTVLAAAYAEKHRNDYRATWWIRAETPDTIRADLAALGYRLGWAADGDSQDAALAKTADHLRREGEGILLIFDNAVDRDQIAPFLPVGGTAHVLITSNAHAWRGVAEALEIRLWPREIGATYLIARTGRTKEQAAAEALSDALGGLPLAHEMAAAFCEDLGLSLATYHRRFDTTPAKVLDDVDSAPTAYHDRLTVAKTFALAIEAAAKLHPAAEPLLVAAALLPAEPIPLFLFAEAHEKLADGLDALLAEDGLERAVAALRRLALVDLETIPDERDPAVTTDTIRLHRLIRTVAGWRREGDAANAIRRGLIGALAAVYPVEIYDKPDQWPRGRRLDAIALGLVGEGGNPPAGSEADSAALLNGLAQYRFGGLGAYASARPLFERAVTLRERTFGAHHPRTADALGDLATALQFAGDLAAARPLFERALAIQEKSRGPEHPDTANCLNNLAALLQTQGDLPAARPLMERALAIYVKALGTEHPLTANSLNNLASLLQDQGDLAAARPLYERAVAIREKALGAEHPNTATSLNNLAFLLRAQGDLVAARPLFERSLAIREKALGAEHPATARGLNNLANLLQAQGDLAAARPQFERALAIRERALGAEHPDTATSLDNLAFLLHAQGDLAAARPLFERALAIRKKALGAEHPDTATSLNNLASLLQAQGDLAAARPLFERALAIREKALGAEHPDTAGSLGSLASLLQAQGDLAAARPLFERALAIRERALGAEHPHTATSLNNLARLLQAQGDLAAARPLYERALAIREKALGAEHPDTATGLNNLAVLLQAQGDLAAARPLFERALAIREKALGAEHPDTATSLNNLASLLQDQGDLAAARPLKERALAIHEKARGAEHPDTARSLNNLANLLHAQGDLTAARPLFERALTIYEKALGAEHPDTATSLNNLAFLLQAQGDLAAARPLFERALAIREKALGAEHPDTLNSVASLAGLLDAEGKPAEAEKLHRRALEGEIRTKGPTHPDVLTRQNNLAHSLRLAGRADLAEPYARGCAENTPAVLGAAHPRTAYRRNNLALTLLMLRRAPETDALLAETWRTMAQHYAIVTPAVAFLALLSAGLQGRAPADPIGRLKTLLLGPALPRAAGVAHTWDVGYLLEDLRKDLPDAWGAFLTALLAAINDPAQAPSLDRFLLWRDTPAVKLDAPWPDTGAVIAPKLP